MTFIILFLPNFWQYNIPQLQRILGEDKIKQTKNFANDKKMIKKSEKIPL